MYLGVLSEMLWQELAEVTTGCGVDADWTK